MTSHFSLKARHRASGALLLISACLFGSSSLGSYAEEADRAVPASRFLNSIGVNSAIDVRGENLQKTIECARYLGVRWFRSGPESGVTVQDCVAVHRQTAARFSWGLGSGGTDLKKLLTTGRELAAAGTLLAFEGNNEPNNWGITYDGEAGGSNKTWIPLAKLQRNLYAGVKADSVLKAYPVFSISEGGAEVDNVGLQFLTIPPDAGTTMPPGTKYADFANVHNYIYHPNAPGLEDNKTWKAADPSPACKVDGLYGEYGRTWGRHYRGYSEAELERLPRVTTETGCVIGGPVTEEIHGLNLLSLYLDQFKRGWSYTAVYLMRDRVDEGGNQKFGFYRPDYTPRKAGVFLHNLTTILADHGAVSKPASLRYTIPNQPDTVHDLLLEKSDGSLDLVVWGEMIKGSAPVDVHLGKTFPTARVYDPTVGTAPIQTLNRAPTVHLTMSDHPFIIELPARK